MARPTDQPEVNSTLPHPELNPLVNPLLGQNMGRWAEVYFTTPPEKREEAVLGLLRELEGNPSGSQTNSRTEASEGVQASAGFPKPAPSNSTPAVQSQEIERDQGLCQSCGENNLANQKFCGMCGSALLQEPVVESGGLGWPSPTLPTSVAASFSREESADKRISHEAPHHEAPDYERRQTFSADEPALAYDYPRGAAWLGNVDAPKLMPEYEPVRYRYRIYVGAALAILMGALLYMAWRGTQVLSADSHALPAAAPDASAHPNQSTGPSPVAGSAAGAKNEATDQPDHKASGARKGMARTTKNENVPVNAASTTREEPETTRREKSEPTAAPAAPQDQDNGNRELALAEGYLNGAQGKARDSAEAAKWLWQAVRKQNARAALMLSDLYLRGEGVPKSCDQGRLLLTAAARKGAAGAGERIRNLQAFGCQ